MTTPQSDTPQVVFKGKRFTSVSELVTTMAQGVIIAYIEQQDRELNEAKAKLDDGDNHCGDCCCQRSWDALGVRDYDGKSIPEHIAKLRTELNEAKAENETLKRRVSEYQPYADAALTYTASDEYKVAKELADLRAELTAAQQYGKLQHIGLGVCIGERDQLQQKCVELEMRHSATMLHTQGVVDENTRLRAENTELRKAIQRAFALTPECYTAHDILRSAIDAAMKGETEK